MIWTIETTIIAEGETYYLPVRGAPTREMARIYRDHINTKIRKARFHGALMPATITTKIRHS